MKCPDCEMEVDKLIKSTGTCIACYKRYQNMKYRGEEYKPLKDIKGTNEYNRVMGRRLGTMNRKNSSTAKEVNEVLSNKTVTDDPLKLALEKIAKDVNKELKDTLDKEMEKRGIKPINNAISLAFILPHMYDLFQEDNIIKQRFILDAIYENQIVDSLHILKQQNKDDILIDAKVGSRQRQLQELRTPNHYELELYNCYSDFIAEVRKNSSLMKLLQEANIKFQKTLDNQQNPVYKTNSEFMKNFDFVIHDETEKDKKLNYNYNIQPVKHKYRVRIYNCKGLFGNPTPQTFTYKSKASGDEETYIEAPTEQDAENIVKAMMRDHFSSVKYFPKDIEVIPWEEHLKQKECL